MGRFVRRSPAKGIGETKGRYPGVPDSAKQATDRFITRYRPALRDLEKQ